MQGPNRGRQFTEAVSPDGAKAVYRDRNLAHRPRQNAAITTDERERRIKYGTASWVYGEG